MLVDTSSLGVAVAVLLGASYAAWAQAVEGAGEFLVGRGDVAHGEVAI